MPNVKNSDLLNFLPQVTEKNLNNKVVKIRFIGGGSNGKVFKAFLSDGSIIALKAFRCQGAQNEEAMQLDILSKNTSVKMPKVLFTHADENFAIMGMTFIEGKNVLDPVFLLKNKQQKAEFAVDVINGMSEWHSVCGKKFGDLSDPKYSSWYEYYQKEKQEPWLKGLAALCEKGKFSKKKYDLLCRATELFNKVCDEPENSVLIHGDLNIMNIMADPKTLKLIGFIDPCGSAWADREYDLFQLRNMWGDSFGLYERYKLLHKTSEYTDFRTAYYSAMNEVSYRLKPGLIMPLWEDLCSIRLKREMDKIK